MEIFFTILIMTLVVSLSGVVTRVLPFQVPLPLMQITGIKENAANREHMEIFFTILIMTLVVSLSGVVTRVLPFQVPLPLMQIAIGALLAWPTFGLHVEFDPELFLVLFIPPLLFADGWKTPTREFIEHGREILGLALALVVVTVVGIGFLIYWIVPGIPLRLAVDDEKVQQPLPEEEADGVWFVDHTRNPDRVFRRGAWGDHSGRCALYPAALAGW